MLQRARVKVLGRYPVLKMNSCDLGVLTALGYGHVNMEPNLHFNVTVAPVHIGGRQAFVTTDQLVTLTYTRLANRHRYGRCTFLSSAVLHSLKAKFTSPCLSSQVPSQEDITCPFGTSNLDFTSPQGIHILLLGLLYTSHLQIRTAFQLL